MSIKDLKIKDRFNDGIDHQPEANKLSHLIGDLDFAHYSDSFGFSHGGDGDNGETLSMILSDLIENGYIEVKILKER